ncbi:MAG: hypothetical protein M5U28_31130 [Sandaracinaceae bacterium]|nr:hypothetical protein [Sandaracinaceae bacterium]
MDEGEPGPDRVRGVEQGLALEVARRLQRGLGRAPRSREDHGLAARHRVAQRGQRSHLAERRVLGVARLAEAEDDGVSCLGQPAPERAADAAGPEDADLHEPTSHSVRRRAGESTIGPRRRRVNAVTAPR